MVNKKQSFNSPVKKQFVENRSTNAPVEETGRATSELVLGLRECGNHYALMTGQGWNKDDHHVGCHLCDGCTGRGTKQRASQHAVTANTKIKRVFPEARVITEARVLRHFPAGMDFTIEWADQRGKARVIDVEVDGEQHFRKPIHGTQPGHQQRKDKDKDEFALSHGRRVLRLHYNDKPRWQENLEYAKKQAEKNNSQAWVLFSLSYGRKKGRYRKIKKKLTLKRF